MVLLFRLKLAQPEGSSAPQASSEPCVAFWATLYPCVDECRNISVWILCNEPIARA